MIYHLFQSIRLSNLGMGCMRLPFRERYEDVDVDLVREMVKYAMEQGVNYYDTAWGYHGGNSETVMGEVLSDYPRESYYLATKFPGYDLANMKKISEIFEKQLEKLRTDHVDFYLFHNVCESNVDAYLDPGYGLMAFMKEQKKNGRIGHIGFSCHGDLPVLKRFLDAYGEDLEFCQLQINYLDWICQSTKEKVDMLHEYGIPVWVMEPLRGGKLVNLGEEYMNALRALRPDVGAVDWAFRFLQSIPGVTVILSGMSDMEQLRDNIRIFSCDENLSGRETEALLSISSEMLSKKTLACTSCRYCTEYCPQGLDIPRLISIYNRRALTGNAFSAPKELEEIDREKWPTACLGCRSCERVCPQGIKISDAMADFVEKLKG